MAAPLGIRRYLVHLRLGFNLLLAPIYLWGALLAGGALHDPRFWLGFLSLHLFLYGGTTAFNSYYDRDEGPIGGLLHPPPVEPGLLRFSLAVQAVGLVPAALLGLPFTLGWLVLGLLFAAYSHPLLRLKAGPAAALAVVALGQGILGFALGWLAVASEGLLSALGMLGMAVSGLVVTGLYVVSHCYQTADDRRRGDLTLAVVVGARPALLLASIPLAAGGALLVWWAWSSRGAVTAGLLAAFLVALGAWLILWALRIDESQVERNYHTAMRFMRTASIGLASFLLAQFLKI